MFIASRRVLIISYSAHVHNVNPSRLKSFEKKKAPGMGPKVPAEGAVPVLSGGQSPSGIYP